MRLLFSRKLWLISIAGALAAHFVLYTLLGLGWSDLRNRITGSRDTPTPPTTAASADSNNSTSIDIPRLATQIEQGVNRQVLLPAEQNLKEFRKHAAWLDSHSSEKSISEISTAVRQATKAPDRAYAPVDPPPPGEFDMKSMLLYSTTKVTSTRDHIERTEQTWIDKSGRTMKQTARSETTPAGKTIYYQGTYMPDGSLVEFKTDQDPLAGAGSIYDTIAQSPLLQRLYHEALLPAIEARRKLPK